MWARTAKGKTLPELLDTSTVKNCFAKACGKNASVFIDTLKALVENDPKLQACEPNSVIAAAGQASMLNLPLNPQLGCVHISPCETNGVNKAQLHIDTRGWVQLAIRSGEYKTLNAVEIHDGEIQKINLVTGDIEFGEKISDEVVGYAAYMGLKNGFCKTLYMTRKQIEQHALDYSDSYRTDISNGTNKSIWSKNFDAMAKKTVLKLLLKRYAVVSVDMNSTRLAMALQADQSVVTKDKFIYADNGSHSAPRQNISVAETDSIEESDDEKAPWEGDNLDTA